MRILRLRVGKKLTQGHTGKQVKELGFKAVSLSNSKTVLFHHSLLSQMSEINWILINKWNSTFAFIILLLLERIFNQFSCGKGSKTNRTLCLSDCFSIWHDWVRMQDLGGKSIHSQLSPFFPPYPCFTTSACCCFFHAHDS